MAPTTDLELRHYLNSKSIPCADVEALTGGTANYVWRIKTLLGRSSIIKHAEPFVASNQSFQFPTVRMDFEAKALEIIHGVLSEDDSKDQIVLPPLYHYDPEAHVLNMGDGGSRTLKAAYEDKTLDIPALGLKIGSWLAKFHTSTTSSDLRHKFDNKVGKAVYRHSYNNLATALESQGLDKALGERVNETYGSLLATDDICICHGDFWPGNILLSDHPEAKDLKLTVVDWEMVRNGNGGTDIGQFAAEAWLLDRTRGDRGLLDAFLKGYLEARKLGREDSIRVAVQFGTHIGFWPTRVGWGTKEETGEIVRIGSEILNHVEAEDWAWLGGSDIGVLFAEKD